MIANLSSLAIMLAVLLFAAGLLLGQSERGRALRRAAAFSLAMAFVPAAIACFPGSVFRSGSSPAAKAGFFLEAIGAVAILAVISLASYGFINIRNRFSTRQPTAHGEGVRFAKRRPSSGRRPHEDDDEDEFE